MEGFHLVARLRNLEWKPVGLSYRVSVSLLSSKTPLHEFGYLAELFVTVRSIIRAMWVRRMLSKS